MEFVSDYPESTASLTIGRRILNKGYYEFSSELAVELQDELHKTHDELVDFCYYLVK